MYLHLGVANVYDAKFSDKVPYLAVMLPKLGPLPATFDPLTQLNNRGATQNNPAGASVNSLHVSTGKGFRVLGFTDPVYRDSGPERIVRF